MQAAKSWSIRSGNAVLALALGVGLLASPASAENGKLLATGGVSQIEGAGGGGLVPWALITGYGTRDGVGYNVHNTFVRLGNYSLHAPGVSIGLYDRLEVSFTSNLFDTGSTGTHLGLGQGYTFRQDVYGVKVKLFGDAVYDQDSWMPQTALGVQYKSNPDKSLVRALGAKSAEGVDVYLAATKLFLAQSVLVNATVRETKANQFGLLGFGGDRHDGYSPQFEGSVALLLSKDFVIGGEYRTRPSNLRFAKEDRAWDIFAAYFITKNVSVTAALVDLGSIATVKNQIGGYLSLQIGL